MKPSLTTTGHLTITGSIIAVVTLVLPRFLWALMPSAMGSLLGSKQMQIEWLNNLLQAMH